MRCSVYVRLSVWEKFVLATIRKLVVGRGSNQSVLLPPCGELGQFLSLSVAFFVVVVCCCFQGQLQYFPLNNPLDGRDYFLLPFSLSLFLFLFGEGEGGGEEAVGLCFATNAFPSVPLLAVCGVFEALFTNLSMFSKHGYETAVLFQAIEEHAEVLKARDAMIAALQSSLSAKDMELEVGSFFRLQLWFIRSN